MIILSCFDGMSCGQIAIREHGFIIDKYYASEIDKFAIQQTQYNFPDTIQLGDINNWRTWDLDWSSIDLVLAGSPCQGFSFAGLGLAFDDPRSRLFFVFVEILKHCRKHNPNVRFLLENVDMKKEYLRIISEYVGVFPVGINSALVSAQNRFRWYWSDIRVKKIGLFDEVYTNIPQPIDEGILLKDIAQSDNEVDRKYYLSGKMVDWLIKHENKSIQNKNGFRLNTRLDRKATSLSLSQVKQNLSSNYICVAQRGREDIKCLSPKRTEYGKQIRKQYERGQIKEMRRNIQQLEPRNDGKTNTLTGVQKDNLLQHGSELRRLTPIECSRLQTIPDWYKWTVSDSQIYRMLGNGWTVKVIKHIISFYEPNQS